MEEQANSGNEPSTLPEGTSTPAPLGAGSGQVGKGAKAAKSAAKRPSKAKVTKGAKKTAKPAKGKAKKAAKAADVTGPAAILREYAADYVKTPKEKATTEGGHQCIDNDDRTAKALRGMKLEQVYREAAKVLQDADGKRMTVADLQKKYGHLNPGMQRMNLGNRIRAAQ